MGIPATVRRGVGGYGGRYGYGRASRFAGGNFGHGGFGGGHFAGSFGSGHFAGGFWSLWAASAAATSAGFGGGHFGGGAHFR